MSAPSWVSRGCKENQTLYIQSVSKRMSRVVSFMFMSLCRSNAMISSYMDMDRAICRRRRLLPRSRPPALCMPPVHMDWADVCNAKLSGEGHERIDVLNAKVVDEGVRGVCLDGYMWDLDGYMSDLNYYRKSRAAGSITSSSP